MSRVPILVSLQQLIRTFLLPICVRWSHVNFANCSWVPIIFNGRVALDSVPLTRSCLWSWYRVRLWRSWEILGTQLGFMMFKVAPIMLDMLVLHQWPKCAYQHSRSLQDFNFILVIVQLIWLHLQRKVEYRRSLEIQKKVDWIQAVCFSCLVGIWMVSVLRVQIWNIYLVCTILQR